MIRVGVDVAPLVQDRAGTARYVRGVLDELERTGGLELRRLGFGGPGRATAVIRDTVWYPFLLPRRARAAGLDVLHCTTYRAPPLSRVPVAVTVHDLAILRNPSFFTAWTRLYGRFGLRDVLRRAARILAVSDFTKREVVELVGVPEERVRVTPNAVDATFTPEGPRADGEYVLSVGTLEPRKNLPRLIEAARIAGVELRVVGAVGWGDVRVHGDGVRPLGYVDDGELARLYRGALCFAYPSLYEGFGIPVVEAMACGTAVVTSAGGACEEVAGGAAELVDPLDTASIADGILRAIGRRDELVPLGLARARRYTWRGAADATVAAYRELV